MVEGMAHLLGLKSSPPDDYWLAKLAKSINRTPPEIPPEAWRWLALCSDLEWLTQTQALMEGGGGHELGADTLLYLKALRDEAKKQWPKK